MFRQYWRLSDRIFLYLQICYASLKPKYQNKRIYRMISRVFVGGCFGAAKLPEINVWYWQEKLVALVSDVQKYNCIYIYMEQAYSWRYGLIVNKKLYKISVNSILRLLYSFSISILFTIFVWFYFFRSTAQLQPFEPFQTYIELIIDLFTLFLAVVITVNNKPIP